MKKSTLSLLVLAALALSSCATGSRPQRPTPLRSGHRHGGSIVMAQPSTEKSIQ